MGHPVRDEYLLHDGLRLHVRDWSGPSGSPPAIVLLHGYTGHARTWDALAESLASRYRVLAPDARGHGESGWAGNAAAYGVASQVADVVALLAGLGVERASVLGLSMGGRTALNLAARHPDLVERLVVVDIGPEVAPAGAARIGASVGAKDVFDSPDEAFSRAREQNPIPPDDVLRHRVRNNLLLLPDGRWTWRYDPVLRAGGAQLPRPDVAQQWASLASIAAPTLLVRGELSDVLDPEHAQRMVADIADCTLVEVEGAGHPVPLDQPDRFLGAIRSFLSL
jgi:pimeloyl-ACP methyl ester carboxylesterase